MKNKILSFAILLYFLFLTNILNAQEMTIPAVQKTDSIIPVIDSGSIKKSKSYFKASASYVNDNVYLGRKDSVTIPYLTPSIGYYAKSGFFTSASFSFLARASNSRLDMVSLDMGYSFICGRYEAELTGSKFFYGSQSTSVKSTVQASLDYFNAYDLGFIRPSLSTTINIGTKLDIAGAAAMEHTFTLLYDKGEITPSLTVNASTQNYYSNYYKTRRYNPKRKTIISPNGVQSISGEVINAGSFKILDYEFSSALQYSFGRWSVVFIPAYAIPVHPSEVIITTKLNNGNTKSTISSEKLENTFFSTVEINLKF